MDTRGGKLPGFGQRLRAQRTDLGMTQQDVADALAVSLRTYQRYESGDTEPTLYDLASICIELDVDSGYLLGLTDKGGTPLSAAAG